MDTSERGLDVACLLNYTTHDHGHDRTFVRCFVFLICIYYSNSECQPTANETHTFFDRQLFSSSSSPHANKLFPAYLAVIF